MAIGYGPPDPGFLRELQQVSIDAVHTAETLATSNRLPDDFPTETVTELCNALSGLKDGTSRNAGVQLEISRAMLPRIRREHFYLEDQIDPGDDDDLRLIRGMVLDQNIAQLLLSVTTALDEYRHQLQSYHGDKVGVEDERRLPATESLDSLSSASLEISDRAQKLDRAFEERDFGKTVNSDTLRRRVNDGSNLAKIANAQLHLRPIVLRWFRATVSALLKTPSLLERAGKAIKIGVDIAEPFADWFVSCVKLEISHLAEIIGSFGEALEETGKRLGKYVSSERAMAERQRDPAVEAAEDQVRQMLLAGVKPPKELADLVEIMTLSGKPKNITIIPRQNDIGLLSNLKVLRIFNTNLNVSDILALDTLSGLTSLSVHANNVSDISALGTLSGLTSLSVHASNVTDISALGTLSGLTSLTVQANNVTDISALGTLSGLTSLTVQANIVTDISALGTLSGLTSLSVHANNVSDISALGTLSGLTSLSVHANNVSDISALGTLSGLTSLSVHANNVSDISALGTLSGLTSLTVQANNVTDISALGTLSGLTSLSVQASNITDISALGTLSGLTSLSVQANIVTDISALGTLSGLTSLSVQANIVTDISALGTLSGLTSLTVQANIVTDISALGTLSGLTSLTVQANNVTDISALGTLSGLTSLTVFAEKIDLDHFSDLLQLTKLRISARSILGLSNLKVLPVLREVSLVSVAERVDLRSLEDFPKLESINLSMVSVSNYGSLRHLVKHA